ncbi:MAG: hypothetical protein EPO02_10575 [Nitrospirae bacterium]|nr:MAG: hypothetical protein EPO02_10575 [Nitrospirota bacterium]
MTPQQHDPKLARQLILDELFDLSLYKALRGIIGGESRKVLDELVLVETEHLAFWQKFFDLKLTALDLPRRIKLQCLILVCRLFGATAVHLVLEAIEVHGVRKYLSLWKSYKGHPLGHALERILLDEFKHEDVLVTQLTERKINPEKIRNIFLGMNDGLVEILGAVSGFFGAFGDAATVLIAASTTAVAGSLSMGAGIYVAISSEKEVKKTESDRQQFLKAGTVGGEMEEQPLASAFVVGGSYIAGAMVPVLPVLFGAKDALPSLVTAGSMIILVSMVLAFLSGMDIKKRILTNLVIIACAVAITYAIGIAAKALWGVSV